MASTYHKTASNTAKANGWTLVDGYAGSKLKRIFDFSLLDALDVPEEDKEAVRRDALKNVYPGCRESFYMEQHDNFTACMGFGNYIPQAVYNKAGKRLYDILHLVSIKHVAQTRKSVYDDWTGTETKAVGRTTYIDIDLEV